MTATHPAPVPRRMLVLTVVPLILAALAEAAWIAILIGLVQEFALQEAIVDLPPLALLVGAAILAGRFLPSRVGDRWPLVGLGLVGLGSGLGWLAEPAARAALAQGDVLGAMAAHPGGLLTGVAVVRGFAHAGEHLSAGTLARVLFVGIPVIGVIAALGGMVGEPWRSRFVGDLTVQATVFIAAGLLALALAGFAEIQRSGAPTWRRNPVWLGLLLVLVGVLVAVSVPTSVVAGPMILLALQAIIGFSLVPLVVAGLLARSTVGLRRTLLTIALGATAIWLMSLFTFKAPIPEPASGVGGVSGSGSGQAVQTTTLLGVVGIVTVLVAVGVLLLLRAWLRSDRRLRTGDLRDLRLADLPEGPTGPPGRRRRRRRGPTPRTAEDAYLALIADLDDRPGVRRLDGETPSEHAGRLRGAGDTPSGDLRLELLAADYGLARFGGRTITPPETRRAIERWRALRRHLGTRPALPVKGRMAPGREADPAADA